MTLGTLTWFAVAGGLLLVSIGGIIWHETRLQRAEHRFKAAVRVRAQKTPRD